ncbi:MAG: hypothetical protein LBB07_01565 [Bifidobacteriaceae bacterium]|jgi:hypothetical protein|nr:hypothetical protein [Bifidobacteriaceae bacterium]
MEFGTGLILLCAGILVFVFFAPSLIYKLTHGSKNTLPHNFPNHITEIETDKIERKDFICL